MAKNFGCGEWCASVANHSFLIERFARKNFLAPLLDVPFRKEKLKESNKDREKPQAKAKQKPKAKK